MYRTQSVAPSPCKLPACSYQRPWLSVAHVHLLYLSIPIYSSSLSFSRLACFFCPRVFQDCVSRRWQAASFLSLLHLAPCHPLSLLTLLIKSTHLSPQNTISNQPSQILPTLSLLAFARARESPGSYATPHFAPEPRSICCSAVSESRKTEHILSGAMNLTKQRSTRNPDAFPTLQLFLLGMHIYLA